MVVSIGEVKKPAKYEHKIPSKTGSTEYHRRYGIGKRSITLPDSTVQPDVSGSKVKNPNVQITNLQSSYRVEPFLLFRLTFLHNRSHSSLQLPSRVSLQPATFTFRLRTSHPSIRLSTVGITTLGKAIILQKRFVPKNQLSLEDFSKANQSISRIIRTKILWRASQRSQWSRKSNICENKGIKSSWESQKGINQVTSRATSGRRVRGRAHSGLSETTSHQCKK